MTGRERVLAAIDGRLIKHIQFGSQRTAEFSPVYPAAAGGDGDHCGVITQEAADVRKRQAGAFKVV